MRYTSISYDVGLHAMYILVVPASSGHLVVCCIWWMVRYESRRDNVVRLDQGSGIRG